MAITQSKPGIFLSQPVLQSIPMNPTPCKTHWNSAGSFMSAEPADSRSCVTKWKTTITTCLLLQPSPRKSNSEVEKRSVRCALPPGCLWPDLAGRKSPSENTFCVLPSRCASSLKELPTKSPSRMWNCSHKAIPPLLCIRNSSRMSLLFFSWTSAAGLLIWCGWIMVFPMRLPAEVWNSVWSAALMKRKNRSAGIPGCLWPTLRWSVFWQESPAVWMRTPETLSRNKGGFTKRAFFRQLWNQGLTWKPSRWWCWAAAHR